MKDFGWKGGAWSNCIDSVTTHDRQQWHHQNPFILLLNIRLVLLLLGFGLRLSVSIKDQQESSRPENSESLLIKDKTLDPGVFCEGLAQLLVFQ